MSCNAIKLGLPLGLRGRSVLAAELLEPSCSPALRSRLVSHRAHHFLAGTRTSIFEVQKSIHQEEEQREYQQGASCSPSPSPSTPDILDQYGQLLLDGRLGEAR